jgi:hypothetical protein
MFKVEKFDIKGDGGTDYVAVESATGRVFVSRGRGPQGPIVAAWFIVMKQ